MLTVKKTATPMAIIFDTDFIVTSLLPQSEQVDTATCANYLKALADPNRLKIVRALQAGASGYLLKESAGVEVADAIRAVLSNQRHLSQNISDKLIDDYLRQQRQAGRR